MKIGKLEKKIRRFEKRTQKEKEVSLLTPKKKKSKLGLIIFILALGLIVGLAVFYRSKIISYLKPAKKTSSLGEKKSRPEFNFEWAVWNDEAGFSFEYPKEVKINTHADDASNYSFLTLTAEGKAGKIDIYCNDSQYKDLAEWLSKDSLVKQGSGLESKVASVSAQKVALANGREVMGFMDRDNVLYVIDKNPEKDQDWWNEIYGHILDSFKLIPLKGESQTEFNQWSSEGFDTSGADVVEDVEVIE